MSAARASGVGRTSAAAFGLTVVIFSAALIVAPLRSSATTYGGVSASFALLELVVGVGLLAAALLLLSERPTAPLGVLTVIASAAWFAPVWVGWEGGPAVIRSIGLVVSPLLPLVVLAVAVLVPAGPPSLVRRAALALVVALGVVGALAAVGLTLVREPLRDLYCWSDCTANAFLVRDDVQHARRLTEIVLGLAVTSGVAAALAGSVRLARASAPVRRGSGPALAAAALAGLALAAYAASLHYQPREAPDRPLYTWLFVARGFALLALAAALVWLALRPRLVRGLLARLAVDLERTAAAGGLGRVLAGALGDPGLRLGYPFGSAGRVVDAEGRPLAFHPGRRVTPVVGDVGVVALVEADAASADELERELSPAAHLALGNERLRAEALAHLADVTGSRARIVETADAARRRMERDLHDGAQQRLLALTYDLRAALTIAESSGNRAAAAPLREALERALVAAQELRDIAHGIFPAELTASGLEAALESLADVRPLRLAVGLPPGRRYGPELETATYAVVADAAEDASDLDVTITESDGALHLTLEGEIDWGERLVWVDDRVGAAGGSVRASGRRLEALLPVQAG